MIITYSRKISWIRKMKRYQILWCSGHLLGMITIWPFSKSFELFIWLVIWTNYGIFWYACDMYNFKSNQRSQKFKKSPPHKLLKICSVMFSFYLYFSWSKLVAATIAGKKRIFWKLFESLSMLFCCLCSNLEPLWKIKSKLPMS